MVYLHLIQIIDEIDHKTHTTRNAIVANITIKKQKFDFRAGMFCWIEREVWVAEPQDGIR